MCKYPRLYILQILNQKPGACYFKLWVSNNSWINKGQMKSAEGWWIRTIFLLQRETQSSKVVNMMWLCCFTDGINDVEMQIIVNLAWLQINTPLNYYTHVQFPPAFNIGLVDSKWRSELYRWGKEWWCCLSTLLGSCLATSIKNSNRKMAEIYRMEK